MNLSRYNLYAHHRGGKLIVYNTLFNKVVSLENEYWNGDSNTITLSSFSNQAIEFLSKYGLIIDEQDEKDFLSHKEKQRLERLNSTIFVTLIPGFSCNFNCPYCYENHSDKNRIKEQNLSSLVEYIQSGKFQNAQINLFGGEPLLYLSQIKFLLEELKEKVPQLKMSGGITSNGFFLTETTFKFLLSLGITDYQITIDGNQGNHNLKRNQANETNSYEIIMDNLKRIRKIQGEFRVIVRCNVDDGIEISDFLTDFAGNFGSDKRFSLLIYPISNWKENCSTFSMTKIRVIQKYTKKLKAWQIQNHWLNYYLHSSFGCQYSYPNSLVLMPDGTIDHCTIHFDTIRMRDTAFYKSIENQKAELDIQNADCEKCALYPKCFGYRCHKAKDLEYCAELRREVNCFLEEYFND